MVGFTRLGEAVPPEDLVRLVERLGDLAREIANPPVRLVKTIGDALMLSARISSSWSMRCWNCRGPPAAMRLCRNC